MPTILIIEDDPVLNKTLSEEFAAAGFTTLSAPDGEAGLALATEKNVDLIILDILMPKLDGIEFVYHLKQTLTRKIPIIVLTNLDTVALPEGIDHVLLKANTDPETIIRLAKEKLSPGPSPSA